MTLFGSVYRFEVGYHLRRPVTLVYFGVFFGLAFLFASSDVVTMSGAGALVKRNAPLVVAMLMQVFTLIGAVMLTAVAGAAVLRDFQYGSHELLFTTSITKTAYLGGRFLGACTVVALLHLALPLGVIVGSAMPWVDREQLLAFNLTTYVRPFFTLLLPSVLLVSAIFFAVGALTRNLFWVYTQGIFLLVGYSISGSLTSKLDNRVLAALLDPLGLRALEEFTRYWSTAERNQLAVPLTGVVLANRLLWLGVALAIFALTFVVFKFRSAPPTLRRRKAKAEKAVARAAPAAAPASLTLRDGFAARWRQYLSVTRLSFATVTRNMVFLAITTVLIVNLAMAGWYADSLYGQTVWPVTYTMIEVMDPNFMIFFFVLVTIFAGEAIWRERQLKLDQVTDALPIPTSVSVLGKFTGLALIWAGLLGIAILAGVVLQTLKGYYNYELGLYFRYYFGVSYPILLQITALAFFVHALVNHKFAGHLVMIVFIVGTLVLRSLGVEHQLFHYGSAAPLTYSDMNRFGPFVPNLVWSFVYWSGVAILFGLGALALWVRGTGFTLRERIRTAGGRLGLTSRALGLAGLVAALIGGGVIFYNANVLNHYESSKAARKRQALYERTYKSLEHTRQPRLIDADVRADLEPEHRRFAVAGTFTFVNRHEAALDTLIVTSAQPELTIDTLSWSRPTESLVSDSALGTRILRLREPLAPGDTIKLRYRARWIERGFGNDGVNTDIVENGTFINSQYFPALGYQPGGELGSDEARRKEKLPERERMPRLGDESARANTYLGNDSDWITFRATVSTVPDQIAIAPGYLQREYEENGRRVFEYVMDRPILNFYSFLSARYNVVREEHDGIRLEIYYQPGHEYNLDRMMESMKKSLDYYGANFSPYQFRQVRIIEFPRYAGFAQAFPNTVPYSESIGFILRQKQGDDDLDMPFYVTAHEVGHQWWAHQVIGARMQGSTLMSESMSNYAALTVLEKDLGPSRLRKFLAHEADRYLTGRANETKKEMPLYLVENQAYIHYNKGSLVLYALRDLIGEDAMNQALSAYLRDKAFQQPPYTTSAEFLSYLEAVTPDSLAYALEDFFRTITLWDFETESAEATAVPGGGYRVRVAVKAKKFRADSVGNQTEIPVHDLVDVGVFGAREPGNSLGKPLVMERHWVTGDTTFEFTVREAPEKAGIDPYNKLIDRDARNNVKSVSTVGGAAAVAQAGRATGSP
ncbi:MAG: M1 family aminopeptidase [Gemmatimonadales bacterium]